jgi:antitoxin ParD1/3/4
MATMNISLPDQMKAFAEAQTRDGRYSNVSDYMRDLIRRDQERRQAIAEIQALVDEGLASGPGKPFDPGTFFAEKEAAFLLKNPDADL